MSKPLASPQYCHFQLHVRQSCHLLHRQERHFQIMQIQKLTPGLRLAPGLEPHILDWVRGLQIWNREAGRLKKRRSFLDSHMWIQWLRQSQSQIYQNGSTSSSCEVWLRLEQEDRHQDEVAGQQRLGYFSSCYAMLSSLDLDGILTIRINRRNERKQESNERQCEKGK